MPVTIPGVSTVVVDGYFSAADDRALNARRILIVAPANATSVNETPGYLLAEPTNELYNPTLYRSENDVVTDFGLGSPAHVAYSQVLRAGGSNIYISATAPHAAADLKPEPVAPYATYTRREFEVIQALESVDLVLPELIVVVGYAINEYVTEGGTDRCARYGEIAAQSCAALTAESFPCEAVFSVVDIQAHLDASRASHPSNEVHANLTLGLTTAALTFTAVSPLKAVGEAVSVTILAGSSGKVLGATVDGSDITIQLDNTAGNNTGTLVAAMCEATPAVKALVTTVNAGTGTVVAAAKASLAGGTGTVDFRVKTTFNPYKLTAGNVNEYVTDLAKTNLASAGDWFPGVPFPIQFALDAVEGVSDADGPSLSRFIVLPIGEIVTTAQPADAGSVVKFKTAAAAVCGHIFATPFNGSITLKRFQNVRYVRYRLSKSNMRALIAVKACPINVDSQLFPITVDGVTAAQDKAGDISHFTRLQTLTICNQLVRGSREICEVYIGKTADENTLNALETQLRSYYLDLKQMGAVRDIRFQIEFIYTQFKLNVNITVVPSGEIREIDLNVGIALQ
jgi:hypothetical protein